MAAFQALTTTAVMIAGTNSTYENLFIQNLGPNTVFVEMGAAAVATTSLQVAATTGTLTVRRPPLTSVNVIAATANQVSPADTRFVIN